MCIHFMNSPLTVGKPINNVHNYNAYTYTMYTPTSGVLGVGDGLGGV